MKIGAYQIYLLLTIFCLLVACSVEENEKESTIYKLRTEVCQVMTMVNYTESRKLRSIYYKNNIRET